MKKKEPLDCLRETVAVMRRLGVREYDGIVLEEEPGNSATCVHGKPRPGSCEQCENDLQPRRLSIPHLPERPQ